MLWNPDQVSTMCVECRLNYESFQGPCHVRSHCCCTPLLGAVEGPGCGSQPTATLTAGKQESSSLVRSMTAFQTGINMVLHL
jgi:hypothetical protein